MHKPCHFMLSSSLCSQFYAYYIRDVRGYTSAFCLQWLFMDLSSMDLSEPFKAFCPHNLLWQQVHYLLCRQVLSHICFKLIYHYFQSTSSPNTVRFGDQQFHIQLIYHFHDFVNLDCISHTYPWPSPLQTEEEEILSALQDVICGICSKFNLLSCQCQPVTYKPQEKL